MSAPAEISPRTAQPLILASTSQYRQALLTRLGLAFTTASPGVDETAKSTESASGLAERLAGEKALAVAHRFPGSLVIGSDQVAVCEGRILGKPGTHENALEQLLWQAGRSTHFHTAVCLARNGPNRPDGRDHFSVKMVTTRVIWRSREELSESRLRRYIALENPIDCAGAAKSEGLGISLIAALDGPDPTALVGLPLIALTEMLIAAGLDPL